MKSFIAFSCSHFPFEHKPTINRILNEIQDRQPDVVVHLGDLIEADAASQWGSEVSHSLQDEFDGANGFLQDLLDASPKAEHVFMMGNHDFNLENPGRIDKRIRSLCGFKRNLPALKSFKVYDYAYNRRAVHRIGQVSFYHGNECGASSDEAQSIILGVPYGLGISGHTHRGTPVTQARKGQIPLPYWSANAGCSREFDCDFMLQKRQFRWSHGMVVGEAKELKSPRLKCCWEAESVVFDRYDDAMYK